MYMYINIYIAQNLSNTYICVCMNTYVATDLDTYNRKLVIIVTPKRDPSLCSQLCIELMGPGSPPQSLK
uniref:Uncharacterized protein n=1 Tax=Rhizophora mucronata TaxID=61149 RepID=A0A2P2MTQ9_RHIMU